MGFINDALIRLDYPAIADERVIDTVKLARRKFPGSPANLDALCKRFDIDASHRTSHGALIDAELLAKVYIELIGGKQQDLMLKKPNRQASTPSRVTQRPPRQFPASDAERKAHATFIDGIDQALWKQSPKH